MTSWTDEVFAYFRHPITNAFTECMNGLAKLDNRMGRGYSFDALRAKTLLKYSSKRPARPKFDKSPSFTRETMALFSRTMPSQDEMAT
jgi:hypothetical protein